MSILKRVLFLLVVILSFEYCIPPQPQVINTDVGIDLTDKDIQKVYNFQDKLQTDSLLAYFKSDNPSIRYVAAMAFGSVKDVKALAGLQQLLEDPADEVKISAAYAIGQIGDSTATAGLLKAFRNQDTLRTSQQLNAAILEAIGKSASIKYLKPLATISTYKATDTTLLDAQSYAIYRFMLRDMVLPEGTQRMTAFTIDTKMPPRTRLLGATYLARAKDVRLDSVTATKIAALMSVDNDYRMRLVLAKALGKASTNVAMYSLISQLGKDNDARVKVAAIQALHNYNYGIVAPVVRNYLYSQDLHLAQAAANYFLKNGNATDAATDYWALAKDTLLHPTVQLMMYQATNRYVSPFMPNTKSWVNAEIARKYANTNNAVEKVAALRALAEYGWNYRNIKDQGFQMQSPYVRTSTVEILGEICKKPDFYRVFGNGATKVRIDMYSYMLEALEVGDPGIIAVAAEVLRVPEMGFKYFYLKMLDKSFLVNAQNKLNLPKDIESWNELQKTIDYFNGVTTPTVKKIPDYNQPIDWKLFNSYNQEPVATIQTKYGNIVVELWRNKAPGTVVNFIQLANNNFYNGKTFHRVVSNFVIQGGCPRGDGYGALDYTIRSELPPARWETEGLIGMASAGNHTEGTQFFITDAPALHLDGNYTMFGKVKSGLDIVHRIQAGDLIEKITVK